MKKLVYLGGMMDGVSVEDGLKWRLHAAEVLKNAGFDVYNPYDGLPLTIEAHAGASANEVFGKDIYYLDKSDILLVNLELPETMQNKNIPMFTIGEMFLAHRDRKPVVAWTNCLGHRAGYKAIVTKDCGDLEECLEYIVLNYT